MNATLFSTLRTTILQARPFLFCALLLSLFACTASKHTDIEKHSVDTTADFSQMKTYRWDFAALGQTQPKGAHTAEFDRVLCEHVDKHMAQLGFTRVEKGSADFLLDYRVVVTQNEAAVNSNGAPENEQKPNAYGLRWTFDKDGSPTYQGLHAPKDQMEIYQSGTLHLAAFDNQNHIIWHSSATRILSERGNEAERRAALRIAVNKLLGTFPTKK